MLLEQYVHYTLFFVMSILEVDFLGCAGRQLFK